MITDTFKLLIAGTAVLGITACNTTEGSQPAPANFAIQSIAISSLTKANLCTKLGGRGAPPTITIKHSPQADVRIKVRMYDKLSTGGTYPHKSTTVKSDASGTTRVNYAFLPPCNTTGGRIDSSYRIEVTAGSSKKTKTWGSFDSGSRKIF